MNQSLPLSPQEDLTAWLPATSPTSLEEMDTLVKDLADARRKHSEAKDIATDLWHKMEDIEQKVISALRANGKTKYEAEGVALVSVRIKDMFSTPKDIADKSALYAYIQGKYGAETLTSMLAIHSATLNSWANKEIESDPGLQIPGLALPTSVETLYFSAKK